MSSPSGGGPALPRVRLRLLDEWRAVILHAWSMRLIALSLVLDAAEFGVDFLSSDPPIPHGSFLALGFVVKIGAGAARLVVQSKVSGDKA